MEGFVYVMTNPAMAGLVKVGMTEKMPHLRALEMSAHEGLPTKMQLEYWALVTGSARRVEHSAHRLLASYNAGKEWFRCDVHVAIATVRECAMDNLQHEKFVLADRLKAEEEKKRRDDEHAKESRRLEQDHMAAIAKNEVIERLVSEFHRLHPKANEIISRSFFSVRLKGFPLEDILVLVQYYQVGFLLSKLGRYPKKSWFDEFLNGGYCSVGTATIDEFCRRAKLSQDKTPFRSVMYESERKILGL